MNILRRRRLGDRASAVDRGSRLILIAPLGFLKFPALERRAGLVITPAGDVQEQTTVRVPGPILRDKVERPTAVTMGTDVVAGRDTS